jgi:hypothetical protein
MSLSHQRTQPYPFLEADRRCPALGGRVPPLHAADSLLWCVTLVCVSPPLPCMHCGTLKILMEYYYMMKR